MYRDIDEDAHVPNFWPFDCPRQVETSGQQATSVLRHPLPLREGKVELLKVSDESQYVHRVNFFSRHGAHGSSWIIERAEKDMQSWAQRAPGTLQLCVTSGATLSKPKRKPFSSKTYAVFNWVYVGVDRTMLVLTLEECTLTETHIQAPCKFSDNRPLLYVCSQVYQRHPPVLEFSSRVLIRWLSAKGRLLRLGIPWTTVRCSVMLEV